MSIQFFSKLSQNYIEILDDDEYYDVTIEVGEDPNVKIFRSHLIILCHRSPFLRRALASKKKNDNNNLTHIKLSNISPEIFQIILKYLYGGIFSLNEHDILNIFKILIAADELLLQELVNYLQTYFIENKIEWMEQNFELVHRTTYKSNNLSEIQQFCIDFIAKSPEKIFNSLDFTSLPEKFLISLIKKDDLQMKEIEVWEHVLKWGLAKNQTLIPDPDTWTDENFKVMENTLQNCLPLIRFYSLSSKEFLHKVRPYRKLFKQQFYENLLNSYMDPDIEPNDNNISLPRNIKIDGVIDTTIVNLNIISIISRWIDKVDFYSKFSYLRGLYLPFKYELLLRGSRDGFSPKKFHDLCNDKSNTVTFIKVKGTSEILGGYNPSIWKSSDGWGQSLDSFIFSFKDKDEFNNPIFSRVKDMDNALYYYRNYGPSFGSSDLKLQYFSWGGSDDVQPFNYNECKQKHYEKTIRDIQEEFHVEDYEQHFELVYRTIIKSNNLSEIQQFCIDFMAKSPEEYLNHLILLRYLKIFLISLIKRDDLQMKEIEVWEHVLKWGLKQNENLISDPDTWTDDDFKMKENTLQHCLPLIRLFYNLSPKEFLHKVRTYKKLFKQQLYENLLNSYMDPDIEPNDNNILLPRNIKIDEVVDTTIVNLNIITIISRWIDKVDFNNNFSYLRVIFTIQV
ncbi:hypothetical protein C1646_770900 [Rhizophagus diaphanus]|nr:hypothetical protein C1646_770900 [Rhizophagus diaphanus] [Rhizophagus sp. MUCL 43196]